MGWSASGGMGGVPRHVHMHVHARTHTKRKDKHVRKLQMAATTPTRPSKTNNHPKWL